MKVTAGLLEQTAPPLTNSTVLGVPRCHFYSADDNCAMLTLHVKGILSPKVNYFRKWLVFLAMRQPVNLSIH